MAFTVDDAFKKFKSRLELTPKEQDSTSRRHIEVRDVVKKSFTLDRDFLTGSYKRYTKIRPLLDVDVFCVLKEDKEGHRRDKPSANLIEDLRKALADHYGTSNVHSDRRCVVVRFGTPTKANQEEEEEVFSIDVVPAFDEEKHYIIPDPQIAADWAETDPEVHAEKSSAANAAFSGEWVPLVKMIKKWNSVQGRPIQPSFLLEVMALELLYPPFSGGYIYELKSFFATAAARIDETWEDPAGLGPPVSDEMTATRRAAAKEALYQVGKHIDLAIQLHKQGRENDALRVWREKVFGPMFPLS